MPDRACLFLSYLFGSSQVPNTKLNFCVFSKLPIRQFTGSSSIDFYKKISKLPIRQFTKQKVLNTYDLSF